jgi:hypothetical protein
MLGRANLTDEVDYQTRFVSNTALGAAVRRTSLDLASWRAHFNHNVFMSGHR